MNISKYSIVEQRRLTGERSAEIGSSTRKLHLEQYTSYSTHLLYNLVQASENSIVRYCTTVQ